MSDLAPLHSEDAERSVLGGLLFRPTLIGTLTLEVRDFYSPKHQAVFEAMRNLDAGTQAVDPMTVAEELRRMGRAAAVGREGDPTALAYLMDLSLSCPSPENVELYARTLGRYAQKRAVVASLSELLHQLKASEMAEGDDVLLEAIHRLQKLDTRADDPSRALGDLVLAEIEAITHDLDAADRGDYIGGMPTGINRLDNNTGGLPLGSTTVVMGETGSGKSTLAMSFARAAYAEAHDTPLLFSYEDSLTSFARRRLAQDSGVPTWRIGARRFDGGEARQVMVAGARGAHLARERVFAYSGQSVDDLCQTVRRLRARGPQRGAKTVGRLVIVDYIQVMPMPKERWINSRPEGIAELSRRLEDLAARENIAVVIFSQVNDEPSKRSGVIQLRDCADGRGVVKGCKLALGIYRPEMYDQNADPTIGKLIVLKNNQGGSVGKAVDCRLDLATHSIGDV